jgi:signal transduction histidine kinase
VPGGAHLAWRRWPTDHRWLWPHYLVMAVLVLVVAAGYEVSGWTGAIALVAPVAMMHLAIRQYVDRTTADLRQLGRLNEQLQAEIAQRQAAEEVSARLAREAARAATLEELSRLKSELVSIASHELRTPIAGIVGYSDLLLHDPDASVDQRQRWLAIINRQGEHLAALVDNLLDVSRIESGALTLEARPVDLPTLLPSVVEPLAAASSRHAVVADVVPDARWVQADPGKLRQILANLVGNAIKYSPGGGRVTITARRQAGSDQVDLSVADQGIGIPREHLGRIFERFQRVDGATTRHIQGTGLGLYIVRQLVLLHGGTIRVESEVGRGSTFHVTLPAARALPLDAASGQPDRGLSA